MKESTIGKIAQLYRYPVKSMRGETCQQFGIDQGGVVGDRIIALQDVQTGKLVTAKQPALWKAMLLLETQIQQDGTIRLTFPSGEQISSADQDAPKVLSNYLGRPVTILASRPNHIEMERADPEEVITKGSDASVDFETMPMGQGAPTSGFVDYGPIHIIATSSLDDVGQHSQANKSEPERFRPNIVIDSGELAPFCENDWVGGTLAIGEHVRLHVMLSSPRCAVPTLPQKSLQSDTSFFSHLRKANPRPFLDKRQLPSLGVYAQVISPGEIRHGDSVVFTD